MEHSYGSSIARKKRLMQRLKLLEEQHVRRMAQFQKESRRSRQEYERQLEAIDWATKEAIRKIRMKEDRCKTNKDMQRTYRSGEDVKKVEPVEYTSEISRTILQPTCQPFQHSRSEVFVCHVSIPRNIQSTNSPPSTATADVDDNVVVLQPSSIHETHPFVVKVVNESMEKNDTAMHPEDVYLNIHVSCESRHSDEVSQSSRVVEKQFRSKEYLCLPPTLESVVSSDSEDNETVTISNRNVTFSNVPMRNEEHVVKIVEVVSISCHQVKDIDKAGEQFIHEKVNLATNTMHVTRIRADLSNRHSQLEFNYHYLFTIKIPLCNKVSMCIVPSEKARCIVEKSYLLLNRSFAMCWVDRSYGVLAITRNLYSHSDQLCTTCSIIFDPGGHFI
ncbi:uncharacterized protein LOC134224529 [Armigeres subalbatus]|uniref:uncharacterized protein LOC134224529 n=1 Tax=Armigeres subalbatus TaxID=124917 RepID=UPI002ED25FE5